MVHLPRCKGGRGLQSLVHSWEREIISTAVYLVTSSDPHLRAVVKNQLWLSGQNRYSNLQEAQRTLERLQVPLSLSESGVYMDQEPVPPRQVSKMVKTAQMGALQETLCQKRIHGCLLQAMPRARLGHLWVSHLALWWTTKSGHRSTDCCCAEWGDPHSSLPSESVKTGCPTILLSVPQCPRDSRSCPVMLWTTFMDAVQTVPRQGPVPNGVNALQKPQFITVLESLKWGPSGWDGVAVLEGCRPQYSYWSATDGKKTRSSRLLPGTQAYCDLRGCMHLGATDRRTATRETWQVPGTGGRFSHALAWLECPNHSCSGGRPGFTRQPQGWVLEIAAIYQEGDPQIHTHNAQFEVLCSAVRILRRHLSNDGRWLLLCSACLLWALCRPQVRRPVRCRRTGGCVEWRSTNTSWHISVHQT